MFTVVEQSSSGNCVESFAVGTEHIVNVYAYLVVGFSKRL